MSEGRTIYRLRPLPGHSDYMVSDSGDVWSLKSKKLTKLKQPLDNFGYTRVDLYSGKRGSRRTIRVFKLVAKAFGLRPPKGKVVNHINHDKTDSRLSNLNIVSRSENTRQGWTYIRGRKSDEQEDDEEDDEEGDLTCPF